MRPNVAVHRAGPTEAKPVGELVFGLLSELYPQIGYDRDVCIAAAKELLQAGTGVWAFLATTPDHRDVGVVTLNECAAIYAGGRFGEISELYVAPDFRSQNVGGLLIDAAAALGRERRWPNLEVGAPSVPTWQRTVDFYLRQGFEEVGPRLDLSLTE